MMHALNDIASRLRIPFHLSAYEITHFLKTLIGPEDLKRLQPLHIHKRWELLTDELSEIYRAERRRLLSHPIGCTLSTERALLAHQKAELLSLLIIKIKRQKR